jgi:hypothetical protein
MSVSATHAAARNGIADASPSPQTRRLAGVLLVVLPTVAFGGTSILRLLLDDPAYIDNELRRDLWAAGHAHAGVLLVLSLVALRYVDEAALGPRAKALVRHAIPAAAIFVPAAMFLSVLDPDATEPNALINLAYVGAVSLTVGLLTLGVGLLRRRPGSAPPSPA